MNTPSLVVLEVGSHSKKRVRRLKKKGTGRLQKKIESRLEPYLAEATGKRVIPVVLLYRKKPKRGGKALLPVKFF